MRYASTSRVIAPSGMAAPTYTLPTSPPFPTDVLSHVDHSSSAVLTPELAEIEKIVPYVAKAKKGKAAAAPAGGDVEMTA